MKFILCKTTPIDPQEKSSSGTRYRVVYQTSDLSFIYQVFWETSHLPHPLINFGDTKISEAVFSPEALFNRDK